MKKILICAALIGCASTAWATEYGTVISAKPVMQRDTVMQPSCLNANGTAIPGCESKPVTQTTLIGYAIEYQYKGKTYTARLPENPGKTLALRFNPENGEPIPAAIYAEAPTASPVAAPVAATLPPPPPPAYYYDYGPAYYAPAYYGYGPVVVGPPVVDIGIGIGFRGGCCWGGWGGWHHR
jgi:hypothetical protein